MPPLLIKTTGFDEFLDPSGGAFIKALIMGDHGQGKTPSAAQWPKPIIADCERGLMSVASLKIPYATIKRSGDMDALLDHVRQDSLKPVDKRKYGTFVLDTVDSYQRLLIQERLRNERKENLSGWADWGWLDGKMQQLIERLINLPMNIVVNMHVKDVSDGDGDDAMLVKKARLKGDVKDSIFQDFDLIGQMESSYTAVDGERTLKRQIRWRAEPRFPALRDRSGKLPRFTDVTFTSDDFQQIFDAITAGIDDLPETTQLESLDVEDDPYPEEPQAGPVDTPALPRNKPKTAAKTAAKKAPAKKAAAKPKEEDPWTPPEKATDEAPDQAPDQATEKAAETPKAPAAKEEPKAAEPTKEPAKKPAKSCGDQPDSMTRFDAVKGCGTQLTPENATRAQIAMLRAKTYLCDDCFAAWQKKEN